MPPTRRLIAEAFQGKGLRNPLWGYTIWAESSLNLGRVVAVILLTLAAGWRHARAAELWNANAGGTHRENARQDACALKNSIRNVMVLPDTESRSPQTA